MNKGNVRVEHEDGVLVLTLDAPASRNAMTPYMLCMMADAIEDFSKNPKLRAAIITGSGEKAFCAGGDLAQTLPLLSGDKKAEDEWDRRLLMDPKIFAASGLREFPINKPIIAGINGACMAGGFELMLGTDIRVCADHAVFAVPEVKRGLIPFAGTMARLTRQIPHAMAMELMLTGEPISAAEAHRIGLVNRVCPAADVMATCRSIANTIADNGPLAVQSVKRTVLATSGMRLLDAYEIENQTKAMVMASQDAREGPRAFMEKRKPVYRGY